MAGFRENESLSWICYLPCLLGANANAKQTRVDHYGKLSCQYKVAAAKAIHKLIVFKSLWEK